MIRLTPRRPARARPGFRPSWLPLALCWSLSLGVTAAVTWRLARPPDPPAALDLWDVPRLADELSRRGLPVGVNMDVVQAADGPRQLRGGAVLSDRSMDRSAAEPPAARCVYVVCDGRPHQDSAPPLFRAAPEVGRIGPFRFRGDAAFFHSIEAALGEARR